MNATTTNVSTRRDSLGDGDLGTLLVEHRSANQEPENRPFEDWASTPDHKASNTSAVSDAATSADPSPATQTTPSISTEKDPYLDHHSV